MTEQVAFAPKPEFEDPDCLGAVFVSDSAEINVRKAVAETGYIITDDPEVIAALDRYEAVMRVPVSEAEAKPAAAKPKADTTKKGDA